LARPALTTLRLASHLTRRQRQVLQLSSIKPRSQSFTTTELRAASALQTTTSHGNSSPAASHFHDFLSQRSRSVSQIHLSAWLTSALSVWKTWMSFRIQAFTMIFEMREKWRHRPKTCQNPIPAQQPPNNLLLSLNPAAMFYTTSA
jgi:hypothetical protein